MANSFSGQKLRSARRAAGLSLRELETRLRGAASAQSISLYERGEVTPKPALVLKLSGILGADLVHLHGPRWARVREAWYRGRVAENRRIRNLVESRLEASLPGILERESAVGHHWTGPGVLPTASDALPTSPSGVESGALALRSHWGLGVVPLPNLVQVLEHRGQRVIEVDVDGFDGCVADIETEQTNHSKSEESCFVINPHIGENARVSPWRMGWEGSSIPDCGKNRAAGAQDGSQARFSRLEHLSINIWGKREKSFHGSNCTKQNAIWG